MNLYLISSDEDGGYDTFDSAVVRAESEAAARLIHPSGRKTPLIWNPHNDENWSWLSSWIPPEKVVVTHLGTSILDEPGVVCSSFNAG